MYQDLQELVNIEQSDIMINVECDQESNETTTHTQSQYVHDEIKNEPMPYDINTPYKYQNADPSDEHGSKDLGNTKMHQVSSSGPDYALCIKYEPVHFEFEDKQSFTNNGDNDSIHNQQYYGRTSDNQRTSYSNGNVKIEASDFLTEESKIKSEPIICEIKESSADEADNYNEQCGKDHGYTYNKCYRTGGNTPEYGFTSGALDSDASDLHASSSVRKHGNKQIVVKPYKCYDCSYSSVRPADLTRHKRKHTREKPYKCDMCSYSAARSSHLAVHKHKHTGEKPYKCDDCSYSTVRPEDLMKHKRKHTREKPYKCDMCSYSAARSSHLAVHKHKHTGEKPYKCDDCSYSTVRPEDLMKHKRKHTGEKPYKCDVCSYSAAWSADLMRHKRKHTGEKPYKCDVCSYSALRSADLTRHKLKHTGKKPYKCDICSYSAARFDVLKTHKKRHTEEKPFKCDVCSFSTGYAGHLTIHKRIHTN